MPRKPFFGALYTYPWDITDEGTEKALDRIVDLTGCSELVVTPIYHVANYFLPHNPKHPIMHGENGAAFFSPAMARYSKTQLHPRVSTYVRDPHYFERIVEAIEKRGLRFSAWIVYFFQHAMTERYPEFAKHDAFGTPYFGQISPSSKDAQEYAVVLSEEIMERFKPHAVLVEALQRQQWRHGMLKNKFAGEMTPRCEFLLNLCFNPGSMENAEEGGMDAVKFRREVADWLRWQLAMMPAEADGAPVTKEWVDEAFDGQLCKYMDISERVATDLWLRVAQVIKKGGGKVQSDFLTQGDRAWTTGLNSVINKQIDRMTTGITKTGDDAKKEARGYLDMIAPKGELLVPISVPATVDSAPMVEQMRTAYAAGAVGGLFYNYGLLREKQLAMIGQALKAVNA
ncbi:MAG: hypothetical protein FJ319_06710 [SAR202 cluster bacterium]|nr:hypothetical protein [SAR202 cluster bacterium]